MKLKFTLPLAFASACLAFAQPTLAQTYTETGDAGDLPATAQIITGVPGVTYTAIAGATTATNAIYDSDMYQLTVVTPATYTFSTNNFIVGKNNFDTQLALFNSSGVGIATDDDTSSGELSTLVLTLTPGNYYLLLSGSGRYAVDSTGALIFPNFTDGKTDPSVQQAATSTLPIAAYTGNTNEGGSYNIAISFVIVPVPEPGSYVLILAGVAGLAFLGRLRCKAAR